MDSTSASTSLFRVGGLVSGLDTDDIITKLLSIERQPINRLQSKKTEVSNKLNAWRDLNTRILALKYQTGVIGSDSSFTERRATSSNNDILTVEASSGIETSSHSITVKQLAASHQLTSQSFGSSTAEIATGTMKINIGVVSYDEIVIDESNNTLSGLMNTINKGSYGVTASIIRADTGDYRMVLTANKGGASNQVSIDYDMSGGTEPTFTTIQEAKDAHIVLGEGESALNVYRSSNRITDVISGATITLNSADPDKSVTVAMSADTSGIKTNIQNFIDQFNNLADFFEAQFDYDAETGATGTLFSNNELLMIRENLFSLANDSLVNDSGYSNLEDLGISLSATGRLSISDDAKLHSALNNDIDNVVKYFTDSETGMGVRFDKYLEGITDPVNGVLTVTEQYFKDEVTSIEESISVKEEALSRMEANYYKKFAAMEAALAKLQSQGSYLDQQIQALSNNNNKTTYS